MQKELTKLLNSKLENLSEEELICCVGNILDYLHQKNTTKNVGLEVKQLKKELDEAHNLEKMYQLQENETRSELNEIKEQLIATTDTLAHKEVELDSLSARLAQATETIKSYESKKEFSNKDYELKCYNKLIKLPYSDATFVDTLTTLFDDRLYFTENGKETLSEYITDMRKSGKTESVTEAWQITKAIATIGWPIWFGNNSDNLRGKEETTFKDNCGFDLQLHETSDTMSDSKYKSLRTFTYEGREIVSPVHIKGKTGSTRNSARVYIAIDQPTKKIIIYHFGSHLDTAKVAKSHRPK